MNPRLVFRTAGTGWYVERWLDGAVSDTKLTAFDQYGHEFSECYRFDPWPHYLMFLDGKKFDAIRKRLKRQTGIEIPGLNELSEQVTESY